MSDTAQPSTPRWERVLDPKDRRRTAYWRLMTGQNRKDALGAVSHKPDGWRAIGYDWEQGNPKVIEYGDFGTRQDAQRVVRAKTAPETSP